MNEVKAYKLTVENVELFEEIEHEVLFQTTIKTKKSILNYLTPVSTLATLLQRHNIILPKGIFLGSIIEIYDEEVEPRVIIGHEVCDFGNVKTVRQLEIYWEEVAF
ncbi:hypothetical protein B7L42_01465 [Acinetobacter baumannii]|uniref:hypothetical protein n=1 Tax=Acinetobacter baumannii TaxID=470 RepID=UPI0009E0F294|nr:hypothetical protein [Acinetobacter baumannii]ARG19202.1 hypothetical protein B7L42_01465 [Acinetobacter baumannii]